jgi:hypothetical protein
MGDDDVKERWAIGTFFLFCRPNLGNMASLVRAAAMSQLGGVPPFHTKEDAEDWIQTQSDVKYLYEVRDKATKKEVFSKWVFGKAKGKNGEHWHTTEWTQDPNVNYMSDKKKFASLRIH